MKSASRNFEPHEMGDIIWFLRSGLRDTGDTFTASVAHVLWTHYSSGTRSKRVHTSFNPIAASISLVQHLYITPFSFSAKTSVEPDAKFVLLSSLWVWRRAKRRLLNRFQIASRGQIKECLMMEEHHDFEFHQFSDWLPVCRTLACDNAMGLKRARLQIPARQNFNNYGFLPKPHYQSCRNFWLF